MYCKNCGNELKEGAKFCGACGTVVRAQLAAEPIVDPAPEFIAGMAAETAEEAAVQPAVETARDGQSEMGWTYVPRRAPLMDGPSNPALAKRIAHFVAGGLMLLLIGLWFVPLYGYEGRMRGSWVVVDKNLVNYSLSTFSVILSILLYGASAALLIWGELRADQKLARIGRILGVVAVVRHAALLLLSSFMRNSGSYRYQTLFGFYAVIFFLALSGLSLYYVHRGPMLRNVIPQLDLRQVTENWKRTALYAGLGILLLTLALLQNAEVYTVKGAYKSLGITLRYYFMADEIDSAYSVCLWLGIISLVLCVIRIFTKTGDGRRRNQILFIVSIVLLLFAFLLGWMRFNSESEVGVHWSLLGWLR